MSIRFVDVQELGAPLPIAVGLSGASGTGKTYTALRVARGMAQEITGSTDPRKARIGFVDTENRRALHYREAFPEMAHYDMQVGEDGYAPERWIKVIDSAEAAKLPVLVIDSFSHAWEGMGGVLIQQAQILDRLTGGNAGKREAMNLLAWAQVKPPYRRLIDRIIRSQTPIIICTRAKPVVQDPKTGKALRKTKTRNATIPWDPASDGDLLFEMGAQIMLDPTAPGCPVWHVKVPDQLKALFKKDRPMDEELGRQLVLWSRGEGEGAETKRLLDQARAAARQGREAYRAFWGGLPKSSEGAQRVTVKTIEEELMRLVAEAEVGDDDDPFGRFAEPEDGPTPEDPAHE